MSIVTISANYEIEIPEAVRKSMGLRPGHQLEAISLQGRIALIPVETIEATRGFLAGIDTRVPRAS